MSLSSLLPLILIIKSSDFSLYALISQKSFFVWLVLFCFLLRLNGNQDDVLGLKVLKFKEVWETNSPHLTANSIK